MSADRRTGSCAESQLPQVDTRTLWTLLLHTPLLVLFWHAPALVHWHGVTPVKSLFFSAVACFRNFGAFVVYSLAWLAVFLAIGFLVSTIGMMMGGVAVARSIMLPTVLVSNVPANTLIHGFQWQWALWLFAISVAWFGLAVVVFFRGLRRYASASS